MPAIQQHLYFLFSPPLNGDRKKVIDRKTKSRGLGFSRRLAKRHISGDPFKNVSTLSKHIKADITYPVTPLDYINNIQPSEKTGFSRITTSVLHDCRIANNSLKNQLAFQPHRDSENKPSNQDNERCMDPLWELYLLEPVHQSFEEWLNQSHFFDDKYVLENGTNRVNKFTELLNHTTATISESDATQVSLSCTTSCTSSVTCEQSSVESGVNKEIHQSNMRSFATMNIQTVKSGEWDNNFKLEHSDEDSLAAIFAGTT